MLELARHKSRTVRLITAVVDNLNRRTAERPAVVQDLHMLHEDNLDNWPPCTNDGFVIFGEESVSTVEACQAVWSVDKSCCRSFQEL